MTGKSPVEDLAPIWTRNDLKDKKLWIILIMFSLNFSFISLCIKASCQTESKADLISNKIIPVDF